MRDTFVQIKEKPETSFNSSDNDEGCGNYFYCTTC